MTITVEIELEAPLNKVWDAWTNPESITQWNFASDDWCCPSAKNDVRPGGEFSWRMEAKDGSFGFDFGGTYTNVEKEKSLSYTLGDNRKVDIRFEQHGDKVKLIESFETEDVNAAELQRNGWQAILGNFKKFVESNE